MSEKGKTAREYFEQGYNCSQAVVLAFAPDLGLDEKTAVLVSSAFGGGMGRLREVCGTVSGMFMVAGLLYGDGAVPSHEAKTAHYARVQELSARFREENGSILCRELLQGVPTDKTAVPEHRTPEYYKKRPCADLVRDAALLMERYIAEHPVGK